MLRRAILASCDTNLKKMKMFTYNNRCICNTLFAKNIHFNINSSIVSNHTLYLSLRRVIVSPPQTEYCHSVSEEHNKGTAPTEIKQIVDYNTELSKLESSVYYGAADCHLTNFEQQSRISVMPSSSLFVNKQLSECREITENKNVDNNNNVDYLEHTVEHMNNKTDKDNSNNVKERGQVNMEQKCSDTPDNVEKRNMLSINEQFHKNVKCNKYEPRDFCVSALCEEGGCLWQWRSVFVIDQPFLNKKYKKMKSTTKIVNRIYNHNRDENQQDMYYSAHLIPFMITTSPVRCWERPCVHRAALSEWLSHVNGNFKHNKNVNESVEHKHLTNTFFKLSPSHLVIVPTAIGNLQANILDFCSIVESCDNYETATCGEAHSDNNHIDNDNLSINEWYASYFRMMQYGKLKSTQHNKEEKKYNKEEKSKTCTIDVNESKVKCDGSKKDRNSKENETKITIITDNVHSKDEQQCEAQYSNTNKWSETCHIKQNEALHEHQCIDNGTKKECTIDTHNLEKWKKVLQSDAQLTTFTGTEKKELKKLPADKFDVIMHHKANAHQPSNIQQSTEIVTREESKLMEKEATQYVHDIFATEYCNVIGGGLAEIIIGADRYAALVNRGELTFAAACWALLCDTRNVKSRLSLRTHAFEIERELLASVTAHKYAHSFDKRTKRTLREQHELNTTLQQQQTQLSSLMIDRNK